MFLISSKLVYAMLLSRNSVCIIHVSIVDGLLVYVLNYL